MLDESIAKAKQALGGMDDATLMATWRMMLGDREIMALPRAAMLRSVDIYCAPNVGGESFGIILTEAMSAGTPVVASDLDAFRRVLDGGIAGVLTPVGDAPALAGALSAVLDDPGRRAVLAAQGRRVVASYDWPVVAATVVKVYETVIAADPRAVVEAD